MAKRRGVIKSVSTSDKGLRLAWIKFIDAYIANGGNATEAYKIAYPEIIVSDKVAQVNGSRLLSKAIIREEINHRYNAQTVTEDYIISELQDLVAMHKDGKGAIVAMKSLECLAKVKGMLVDTKKIAFTGENPAVFLPVYTAKEKEEFEKIRKSKQRITE